MSETTGRPAGDPAAIVVQCRQLDADQFVEADAIDVLYYEKPYFVLPADDLAEEAYAVLRDALRRTKKVGLGQLSVRGREQLVSLKPCGRGLVLEVLRYADEVTRAQTYFRGLPETEADADLLDRAQSGEERFIVAMFVDLRGSTRLAEERLPYDTVFIINRFLGAVGDAVREAGGSTNQFLGDGLLALFGLETEPEQAARDALRAIDGIADAVETLNRLLAEDLEHILCYGVGVHAGPAIVGEMGDATDARFTARAVTPIKPVLPPP